MKYKSIGQIALSLVIFLLFVKGFAVSKSGEEINWQVISSGGTSGTSANFGLDGTIAQTAVGSGNSPNFVLTHGYWQNFDTSSSGPCDCGPGNSNGDAFTNIFDVTYMISFLYKGGPDPTPYPLCSGDPNCDCTANIFDITYLISFLYKGGSPPCTCEDWLISCGPPLR
jgi:hypothetical protein